MSDIVIHVLTVCKDVLLFLLFADSSFILYNTFIYMCSILLLGK